MLFRSRNIAITNDNRIMEMAAYWESKGNMYPIPSAESMLQRFAEFKGLVRRGSFTMEQLEAHVFGRYGIREEGDGVGLNDINYLLSELDKASVDLKVKKNKNEKK